MHKAAARRKLDQVDGCKAKEGQMLIPTIGFIAVPRILGIVSELRVGCRALFSVYQSIIVTVIFFSLRLTN